MILPASGVRVYVAPGSTDMRKASGTLSMLVQGQWSLDPFSGHLFAFCNRRRNLVKVLYWDRNGFCLWQKRLERQKYRWPADRAAVLELDMRRLRWLLEGLELEKIHGHRELSYTTVL
jgi:transposase